MQRKVLSAVGAVVLLGLALWIVRSNLLSWPVGETPHEVTESQAPLGECAADEPASGAQPEDPPVVEEVGQTSPQPGTEPVDASTGNPPQPDETPVSSPAGDKASVDDWAAINDALARTEMPLSYEMSLAEFADLLRERTGLEVRLSPGVDSEAKIALDLSSLTKSVKGSQVIEIVLDQLDLGWLAEDGALVIDTTEHAEEWFATLSGRFARHHPNGQLAVSGYYRNGKEVGEWSWWYEDGTQQLRLSYDDDGENHGVATSWDKQGHLRWEREYVHGVPTGSWKEYWPGGTKAELTFLDGRPDGLHRWWHEGGALLIEIRFDRGELQGPIEFHDVDGRNLEDAIDAGEEADEAERARLFAMRGLLRSVRNCYESAPDSTGAEELADKVRDLLDAVADLKE